MNDWAFAFCFLVIIFFITTNIVVTNIKLDKISEKLEELCDDGGTNE